MPRLFSLCAGIFLLALPSPTPTPLRWLSPELRRMDAEREPLLQALAGLPPAPPPQVTQRLGWHSTYATSADTLEWIDLHLPESTSLDAVVLIAPPPSSGATAPGYGFPLRFRVELLDDSDDATRTVIADYTHEDFPNPGSLPVMIDAKGLHANKVRITATRLFEENKRWFFALGEVMLLQGNRNLGAEIESIGPASVRASSSQGTRPDWGRINLVDGHTVLGPPEGVNPSPSLGFHSKPHSASKAQSNAWVSVDLGKSIPIDEIRLFPTHPPQFSHSHGYGFPVNYQIELRETAEGLPIILSSPQSGSYNALPGDNAVTIMAHHQAARFVRIDVLEPHVSNGSGLLAMAEMQVWSGGDNVALHQKVSASDSIEAEGWSAESLVDGFTSNADIVDWKLWLSGLSARRETLQRLAVLDVRQAALVSWFKTLGWWLSGCTVAVVLAVLLAMNLRQRRARRLELEALHQRISQDLHDEIGSSLGSIVLITADAFALAHDDDLRHELNEIRDTAQQTLDSMRDIVRLAQSGAYGRSDLIAHLREITGRMLRGVPHTLNADNAANLGTLPMDARRDLVLMFKETLHNLVRHAQAKEAEITLAQTPRALTLTIHDNGRGFTPHAVTGSGIGLTNLQRRARKHGGTVVIDSAPGQGTTIRIILPSAP